MKLSLNTFAMGNDWDLDEVIALAKRYGYDGLEFRIQSKQKHGIETSLDAAARQRAAQAIQAAGLETSCISSSVNFSSADAAERAAQLQTCNEIVQLTHDLNSHFIKAGANRIPEGVSHDEFIGYVAQSLREAGEFAATRDVKVLLEMHTPFFSLPENALAVLEKSGTRGVGLIFNCEPEDIVNGSMAAAYRSVQPYVEHIHIHDLLNRKMSYPYEEFFDILRRDNYQGFVSVEISSYALGEGVDGETAFAEIADKYRQLTA